VLIEEPSRHQAGSDVLEEKCHGLGSIRAERQDVQLALGDDLDPDSLTDVRDGKPEVGVRPSLVETIEDRLNDPVSAGTGGCVRMAEKSGSSMHSHPPIRTPSMR